MEILFEDSSLVVAVKPRGVLSESHASEANMPQMLGGAVYPVHRLDRNVGGVMVYAKTQKAAARLCDAVRCGALCKEYTAVVAGEPADSGELFDYLFKDSAKNKSFVVSGARKGAKQARLSYRKAGTVQSDGQTLSRVEIKLETGRSHQIRVQFSSRGYPLVGDGKYGSRIKASAPALFATALSFPHPQSGETLRFCAPVPAEFPFSLFGDAHYEIERKFLIAYPDVAVLLAQSGVCVKRMEQTYLTATNGEARRVRKMSQDGAVRYIETVKRRVSDVRSVEEERELDEAGYLALLAQADPTRRPIFKTRYCIPHAGLLAEVDVYDFWQDRATLEFELESEAQSISFPSCVQVIREITDDARYKNVNLARALPDDAV